MKKLAAFAAVVQLAAAADAGKQVLQFPYRMNRNAAVHHHNFAEGHYCYKCYNAVAAVHCCSYCYTAVGVHCYNHYCMAVAVHCHNRCCTDAAVRSHSHCYTADVVSST